MPRAGGPWVDIRTSPHGHSSCRTSTFSSETKSIEYDLELAHIIAVLKIFHRLPGSQKCGNREGACTGALKLDHPCAGAVVGQVQCPQAFARAASTYVSRGNNTTCFTMKGVRKFLQTRKLDNCISSPHMEELLYARTLPANFLQYPHARHLAAPPLKNSH